MPCNSVLNPVFFFCALVVGTVSPTPPLDERHFVQGLASNPRDAGLRAAYGRWLLSYGRPAEAEVEARSAVAAAPQDPALRVALAEVLAQTMTAHADADAESEFRAALAACGAGPCARPRAAYAAFLAGRGSRRADAEFRAVAEAPDADAGVLIQAARFFEVQEDADAAERAYKRAVELEPSAESLTRYASFLRHRRRQYREAETLYSAALRQDPSYRDALAGYATFLSVVRGDLARAEALFEQALRDPHDAVSRDAYAKLLRRSRKFLRMAEVAREAVSLDPHLAERWAFLDRWDPVPTSVSQCPASDAADALACGLLLGANAAAALFSK